MSFRPSQVRFIDEGGGQQDLESEQPKRYQTLFHSHDQGVGVRGHLVSELKEQGLSQQRSGRGSAKSQRIAEKA
jgi:hypothetical protein